MSLGNLQDIVSLEEGDGEEVREVEGGSMVLAILQCGEDGMEVSYRRHRPRHNLSTAPG